MTATRGRQKSIQATGISHADTEPQINIQGRRRHTSRQKQQTTDLISGIFTCIINVFSEFNCRNTRIFNTRGRYIHTTEQYRSYTGETFFPCIAQSRTVFLRDIRDRSKDVRTTTSEPITAPQGPPRKSREISTGCLHQQQQKPTKSNLSAKTFCNFFVE